MLVLFIISRELLTLGCLGFQIILFSELIFIVLERGETSSGSS